MSAKENNVCKNNEESRSFIDIRMTLNPSNPSKLTSAQKAQLDILGNLSDDAVKKEAETDPDCEPLE